jgi:hypothetical protein
MDHGVGPPAYTLKGIFISLLQTVDRGRLIEGERAMATRRAPKARAEDLLAEALNYATALQLMALALNTLNDDRGKAVHTIAWAIGTHLERLQRLLKRRAPKRA